MKVLLTPTDLFCSNCRVPEFDQSRFNTDTRYLRSRCKLREGWALDHHKQKALEIMETVDATSDTIQNVDDIHTTEYDDVSSAPPGQQPECSTSDTNKNFTPDETDILVSQVAEHRSTLFGPFSNVVTEQSKEKIWDGWMNGVLGHFYALSRLNWVGDREDMGRYHN